MAKIKPAPAPASTLSDSTPQEESTSPSLSPNEILVAEFEYAANSAFQANEDRSKVASFFLVSVGSLVAAIFGAFEGNLLPETNLVLAGLFIVLTLLGSLTIAQLARLRAAWHEAALTMNHIKEYYAKKFKDIQLSKAFRWKSKTLPDIYKTNSISYFTVIEVALLSGLTLGASALFLQTGLGRTQYAAAITPIVALIGIGIHLWLYKFLLTRTKKKENA